MKNSLFYSLLLLSTFSCIGPKEKSAANEVCDYKPVTTDTLQLKKQTTVHDCDSSLYIRNATECWVVYKIKKEDISAQGTIKLPDKRIIPVTDSIYAGITIQYPAYKKSEGNCCEKVHLKKNVRIVGL